MTTEETFRIEVVLADGQTISSEIGLDEARLFRTGHLAELSPADDDWDASGRVLYGMIRDRLQDEAGQIRLRDESGRHWIIPIDSILAVSFSDPREQPHGARWGFESLDEAETAGARS
jgi:hypothetical protein